MNSIRRSLIGSKIQEPAANKSGCATEGRALLFSVILMSTSLAGILSVYAQTPIIAGYRDFSYGTKVIKTPTAEKPESKLWWNDGFWWGSLWDPAAKKYRIQRFNLATQSWINTGPDIDNRPKSLADALWDGQKLYIVSHLFSGGSQTSGGASAAKSGRLYRYSYNAATDTYSLDAGFPVTVNNAISETLVLDKDSAGKLWVTWTQANKVYMNCSLGDDLTWGTPFALPTQGANLDGDDISTLIAFNGKIGVIWSNQSDEKVYFSLHHDGNADMDWESREVALSDPNLGALADDHLNIKLTNDGGGNLYTATKTSLTGSNDPGIYLLKRSFSGVWTKFLVSTQIVNYTRPVVVIDEENRELHVIANGDGVIYRKKVSLDNISFPPGYGDTFMKVSGSADINDPTSSKHNVNSATGMLILASDEINRYYYHNFEEIVDGSAQVVHQETVTGKTSASPTVTTSASLTGMNDHLYLAAISMDPKVGVTAVSGLGLNWTLVQAQCSGKDNTSIEVWKAQGTPSGNGAVTATFASAPNYAVLAVSRYSNVDAANPIGNIVTGNTAGVNGACAGGPNTTSYSFNLPTTVNNARVYAAVAMRNRTHTPGAGYTERADLKLSMAGVAVEDKSVALATTATINGSFSGKVSWALVGLEIKPLLGIAPKAISAGRAISGSGTEKENSLPAGFALEPNYPNPFYMQGRGIFNNPGTMINFSLPAPGSVTLNIYDETGQLVRRLVDGEIAAGRHSAHWNGRNQSGRSVAAGMYFYKIVVQGGNGAAMFTTTKRMTLLK